MEIIRNAIDYCKIYLELNWTKNCGTSIKGNGGNVPEITGTTFKITKTKLYVPIVTLLTNGNEKLTKLLNEGFKRPIYWNKYNAKIESRDLADLTRFYFDDSFQWNQLYVCASFHKTIIRKLKTEEFIHHLKTIFGAQI